jgi:predicted SprT family Zn-dependent metalloprotease
MKKPFNISDFFKIKQRIEECDVFYAALYNLANVSYSDEVSTACITFDKEGNTLEMLVNPDFWDGLCDDAKTFVVLHELYHVVYDHGKRIIELGGDFKIGNISSDIVINHHIHEKVGLHREGFDWKPYCWVETCFPDEKNVPTDKSFEYYYNKLAQKNQLNDDAKLLGSHGDGEKQENENKQEENKSGKSEQKKKNGKQPTKVSPSEFAPENFSEAFKSIMEQNPDVAEQITESPDFAEFGKGIKEHIPYAAPLGAGNKGSQIQFKPTDEKPNFKKLMKLLIPKKKNMKEDDYEAWVGTHRRYTSFLKQNPNMALPNIVEEEKFSGKDKKEVWIFMDSSGSCRDMFDTFSNIVVSLLKEKQVNCRAFAFGDDCEEVDIKYHKISFYSGNDGGFDCIEQKILEIMSDEKIKYPDNVVVLSDGGVHFRLIDEIAKPKNWVLLIDNDGCHHLTPKGAKYFVVDDAFFGLDQASIQRKNKRKY